MTTHATKPKPKPRAKKAAAKTPIVAKPPEIVLVLRTCGADLKSHNGFQWPETGSVEAPDWKPNAECGHGLHGWLWGSGDWSLKARGLAIRWLVVEVEKTTIIDLAGKVKFPRGKVVFTAGNWREAMAYIWSHRPLDAQPESVATGNYGHASATGNYGHASATGYSGHASATGDSGHASATGDYGHASATGYSGHASATGYSGHASATGDSGHASATGDSGHASATGDSGHASATGNYGHASATGDDAVAACLAYKGTAVATNGVIALAWNDGKRRRLLVGYTGENGIESGVKYRVTNGKFVKAK